MKGVIMSRHLRTRFLLSAVAMLGVLMMLGQVSAFAQSTDQQGQAGTQALRTFLLYGGAFQLIDSASGSCAGQCNIANILTGNCTCASGYTPVPSARILVEVGSGQDVATCGSFLYICAK
jgi:hypothetical protein